MDTETLRLALDNSIELKDKANLAYKEQNYSHAALPVHFGDQGLHRAPRVPDANDENKEEADKTPKDDGPSTSSKAAQPEAPPTTPLDLMKQEGLDLLSKCYNNLAACIINGPSRKPEDYLRAVFYCDQVLTIDSENEKAVFRKGCAFKLAAKYEKAIAQFKKCSNNSQAVQLVEECRLLELEEDKKRNAEMRANFAKSGAFQKEASASNQA
uniref:Uncharacterized protein n=1 Tax=Ditylenchus dipsaci TaxID=166011 RepID=A0A915DWD3_9BILA